MTYLGKPSYTGLSDGYTFNTGPNCEYIQFALGGGTTEPDPFPINYPSTDHNYYEYVGQDATVIWETAINNGYVDTVNGIVYDSDNTTTENITPLTISSVIGQNYVWCTTGNSTISYRIPLNRWTDFIATLTAGSTSITISDNTIFTTSTIDIYTDAFGVNPTNVVVSTGSIVLTFEAQQSDVGVKVRVS
jgi:hypothetical protein